MAFEAQGAVLYWSTSTAASTSTSNAIGNIIDFNGPGGQANVIDVTHLGSTAKEKLIGLRDEGQVSMTMLMTFSSVDGQERLRTDRANRTPRKCVIQFNDSTIELNKGKAIFDAACLGYSVTGAVDDAVRANVVIEVLNAVTWTNSSSI
jgi:hypothetical protein